MTFPAIEASMADLPVATCCRVLGVSTSGFYDWRRAQADPCRRARDDAELLELIRASHRASRGTYGARRIQADLVLGLGRRHGRKRIERLMRTAGLQGVHRRRRRGCTRRDPAAEPGEDLVDRAFTVEGPDRLWCADITEHPTAEGRVYAAVVIDAWSRRVVGLAIADHLRAELVVDALTLAAWLRRPPAGQTIHHSDHGCQYTSWAFGQRLRAAGLLGSLGSIGDCFDNALCEAFFATLQTELLDRRTWATRAELAGAIFEYVERFYNPTRRHSALGYLSPIAYEAAHAAPSIDEAA
jgi:putative transposase